MASFFSLDDHPVRAAQRRAERLAEAGAQVALVSALEGTERPSAHNVPSVMPPALLASRPSLWQRWSRAAKSWWWPDDASLSPQGDLQGLAQIKSEFMTVVWDLQSYTATRARDQIIQARSLRELWHLRADVFRVIAVHRGQTEAHQRLASLNRHFPMKMTPSPDVGNGGKTTQW